jgi:uncharacterized protein YkwD
VSAHRPPTGTTTTTPSESDAAPAADAAEAAEAALLAATNTARAESGLPPLATHPCLTAAATQWATILGPSGSLDHRSERGLDLGTEVDRFCPGTWAIVGENLGRGPDSAAIQAAFMASPTHRANVLEPTYTHIGIHVIPDPDGSVGVVVVQFGGVPLLAV